MLPLRDNYLLPDVDALSSCPSHNTASHRQVAPSLRDQRKHRPVERRLPSVGTSPDVSQPSDTLSNFAAPTTHSQSTHSTSHATNTVTRPDDLTPCEFVLHARRDSLSFQQQSLASEHRISLSRYHSEPDIRTVARQAEHSHNSFPGATEAHNQRLRRSSQHGHDGVAPVFAILNSAIISADQGLSTVDTVDGSSRAYSLVDPFQGVTTTLATRDLPSMTSGDYNASPVVQSYPTFSDPFSETIANARTGPTGFVAIPSATPLEDSLNEMWAADVSESRAHVQRITDGWKEDAKGILVFTGIFSAIVASFILESYKMLSPDFGNQTSPQPSPPPAASIIVVNIMWLISLMLNIISALFATLSLQWARRYTQVPQVPRVPRDGVHSRSFLLLGTLTYDMDRAVATTVMLLHFSVFLFLIGLVIFFFTINKIVAAVVSIAVGLFGVVYFTLSILSCIDRTCPYRTPLSYVWWSQRERLGYA